MQTNEKRLLNEFDIGDMILCEPITQKGKALIRKLGLDITPDYFYDNLRVTSKYDANKKYNSEGEKKSQNALYYEYTVDRIKFEQAKKRLVQFGERFCSDSPDESPLLVLGVAGNGKSIEMIRRLREINSKHKECVGLCAYFDLEKSFTKLTYGVEYECPNSSPLWLFCIKLLDGIMKYVRENSKLCSTFCSTINENFNEIVVNKNLVTVEFEKLFDSISKYSTTDRFTEKEVFEHLINILSNKEAVQAISILLEIFIWVMYCSSPEDKHYIVIDNIEQYIKLNDSKIQIPNSDITTLYKAINEVVMNMSHSFNRIEEDLEWKTFKILFVARRTSIGLLESRLLHSPIKAEQRITDLTGHILISDIWANKRKFIWEERLKAEFNNDENNRIIEMVDFIMNDGTQGVGISYQSIIATLMCYGLRRNARAQANAACSLYDMLTNGKSENITYDDFKLLMSKSDNSSARYMFRRALVESQFKWSVSSGNEDRWMDLSIGHLIGESTETYEGKVFEIEKVSYSNDKCISMLRRILTYLSWFRDENKTVSDMFSTVSLFNLINGVLLNPTEKNKISEDDYLQFAKVLIALGDMSNGDTRSAPYVILSIKDDVFHENPDPMVFSRLLQEIFDSGPNESIRNQKYDCSNFGVRITEAGHSFLLDWQPSFSFMASLYCFTIPSLFYLKDITSIKYVIHTVYESALSLCEKYEQEAIAFCRNSSKITLKWKTYLPKYKDSYITFRQRVKELHVNHLNLYRDYIEKNYQILSISAQDKEDLIKRECGGFIQDYINKYNSWDTGAKKCF